MVYIYGHTQILIVFNICFNGVFMRGVKILFNHKSGTLFLFILFLLLINWPLISIFFNASLMLSLIYILIVLLLSTACIFVGMKHI